MLKANNVTKKPAGSSEGSDITSKPTPRKKRAAPADDDEQVKKPAPKKRAAKPAKKETTTSDADDEETKPAAAPKTRGRRAKAVKKEESQSDKEDSTEEAKEDPKEDSTDKKVKDDKDNGGSPLSGKSSPLPPTNLYTNLTVFSKRPQLLARSPLASSRGPAELAFQDRTPKCGETLSVLLSFFLSGNRALPP